MFAVKDSNWPNSYSQLKKLKLDFWVSEVLLSHAMSVHVPIASSDSHYVLDSLQLISRNSCHKKFDLDTKLWTSYHKRMLIPFFVLLFLVVVGQKFPGFHHFFNFNPYLNII